MNIKSPKKALSLSIATVTLLSTASFAAPAPNAGQLLQEQQPLNQLATPQDKVAIETTKATTPQADDQQHIQVNRIVIEGNTAIATAKLHAIVADAEGKPQTLAQLWKLAQRITDAYKQQGYAYSRAYLPQQTLNNGTVRIAVLEARYQQTEINNHSRTQAWLLNATVAPLQTGQQINNQQLEQQLKLLNRLNGVTTRNVLSPGEQTGTSQLDIDVENNNLLSGYIGADNYGNRYTKEARYNAGLSLNNLLGLGDVLSLDGMTTGKALNYGKVGYEFTFTGMGTRAGASYSRLDYELGKELKALGTEGKAEQSSVWLSQPALLSNTSEVILSVQYDHKKLEDDIPLSQYYKHRNIDLLTARLDASHYDQWAGGGLNQLSAATRFGRVKFKNDEAEFIDAQTAKTGDDFYAVNLSLSRLQNLGSYGTQAFIGLSGQYSPYNLDSAEQYMGGGPFSVRGYESSQFSGSSGYMANLELRQRLYQDKRNQLGAKIFIDSADVTLNADKWIGVTGDNTARLSSAGLGLSWFNIWNIQANAEVAFPIGNTPKQMQDRDDHQYWLSLRKTF